jgi:hypothetical protein
MVHPRDGRLPQAAGPYSSGYGARSSRSLERFPLQVNRKALQLFDFAAFSAENRFPLFRKML